MSAELTVSEIGLFDCLTAFEAWRSPLADFYLKTKNCLVLGARGEGGAARGLLLAERGEETELLFLAGEDGSVKKTLVEHLMGLMPPGGLLRWRTEADSGDEALARECGFRYESTLHVFRSVSAEDPALTEVLAEYEPLCAEMESRGYVTESFARLRPEELDQIRCNAGDEYAPELHPERLMDDTAGGFAPELSFAAVKDGRVAAYTIVRAPGAKRCVFEIVCAAKSQRGTGAYLLPVLASIRAMRDRGVETAVNAVYESNGKPMTMLTKRFARLIRSRSVRRHYVYPVPWRPVSQRIPGQGDASHER